MSQRRMLRMALALVCLMALGCGTLVESAKPKNRVPYLPSSETLEACSLDLLWHAEVEATDICKAYLFRDMICLVSASSQLYFVDTATGLIRWQLALSAPLQFPPCDNAKQMFVIDNQRLLAIDKLTGAQDWAIALNDYPLAGPGASDEIVCVPLVRQGLLGHSVMDGKFLFQYHTRDRVIAPPMVVGATVCAGDEAGWVYAVASVKERLSFEKVDRTKEDVLWEKQTRGSVEAPLACNDKTVFAGSKDYKVYALDKLTGAPVWQHSTGSMVVEQPVCVDGMVFVPSFKNGLYVYDAAKGDSLCALPDGVALVAAAGTKNAYVLNDKGKIVALDKKSKQPLWRLSPTRYEFVLTNAWTSPIILASKDGRVVALAEKGAKALVYQAPAPAPVAAKKPAGKAPAPAPPKKAEE